MHPSHIEHLNLLITIVDRHHGQTAVDVLFKHKVLFHRIVPGRGTAKSEMLALLGLGETPKDIIFSLLPMVWTQNAMRHLRNTLQFDNPGHGIAFTVPLNSIGGPRTLKHLGIELTQEQEASTAMEKETINPSKQYDLIIAIVNNGFADDAMDAARQAGAKGGTVVHARGAGIKEAEKFFGITIQPEKEMMFILTQSDAKRGIMEALCQQSGLTTPAHGIIFSMPVSDVMGVARMLRDEEN